MGVLRFLLGSLIILLSTYGCSSYISRPNIEGSIYDHNGKSLDSVAVLVWNGQRDIIETYSNRNGYFRLNETYERGIYKHDKIVTEFLLRKKGFQDTLVSEIHFIREFSKDTLIKYDTIYLNQKK